MAASRATVAGRSPTARRTAAPNTASAPAITVSRAPASISAPVSAPAAGINTPRTTRIAVPRSTGTPGTPIAAMGGPRVRGDAGARREDDVPVHVYRCAAEPQWGCGGEGVGCRASEERLQNANNINFASQFEEGEGRTTFPGVGLHRTAETETELAARRVEKMARRVKVIFHERGLRRRCAAAI